MAAATCTASSAAHRPLEAALRPAQAPARARRGKGLNVFLFYRMLSVRFWTLNVAVGAALSRNKLNVFNKKRRRYATRQTVPVWVRVCMCVCVSE